MKLTKKRLQKVINSINKNNYTQTQKKLKRHVNKLKHHNTNRNNTRFNLRNKTLKNCDVY